MSGFEDDVVIHEIIATQLADDSGGCHRVSRSKQLANLVCVVDFCTIVGGIVERRTRNEE